MPIPPPVIAALVSPLARKGMDLLSSVFNSATDFGVEKIKQKIEDTTGIKVEDIADDKLDPEQWRKLKEFELTHQELLLEELQSTQAHDIARVKLLNEDRADARETYEKALDSEDWLTRNFIHIFALLITLLTFAFIAYAAFFADFSAGDQMTDAEQHRARIVDTVIGFLLGVGLAAIIQFFFGSSQGSSDKSKMIEKQLQRNQKTER